MAYQAIQLATLTDPDIGGVGPVQPTTYGNYSTLFPDPIVCFREMVTTAIDQVYVRLPWNGPRQWLYETWTWHYLAAYIGLREAVHVLVIALALTVIRYAVNKTILEPIPKWFKLKECDAAKFPESTWRALVYALLWAYMVWIISHEEYLHRLLSVWEDWGIGVPVKPTVYWLYMAEIGLYFHSIYATVYMETIKKDFYVMLGHHVVTLSLLIYSYALRFVNIGVLILFLHDFGDIWLEMSKSVLYFKYRNGVHHSLPENIANVTFAIFTLEWILFRLYWYPVKALYSIHVAVGYYPNAPFILSFNVLLWVLYLMHIYWFVFILNLVYRVIVGQQIEDNRDYYDDEDKSPVGIDKNEE